MSLATFFKVATGQYSDDQIRAAAAAYYGRTASSAAVAAVNNDITVNVNIDGETVKQFKPERPKQPEKKPEPEPPKQPEKKPEKQPEKKPESSKATPPKQPEPEPPKQPEKQPEKKPESSKATPPEPPKQPEKKPEQQDVTAQQAAHPVNGFNIAAFTQPQPSATQQVARMPMPTTQLSAVTATLLPPGYNSMSPNEKCDVLFNLAARGVLPPFVNPRAGYTNEQKLAELKKNFTFLHIEGRSISTLQLNMLYWLLESPRLKSAMNRHDAVDRANNPKLTEVPVATHATGEQVKKYDMCFEVKLKDPAKKLVVLYSTVPAFSMATGTWGQELELFVK